MATLLATLIKGIVFGASIAMVPGPIFFLVLQRTLLEGPLIGLFCVLGALMADLLFAMIAATGVSFIVDLMVAGQNFYAAIAGIFLIYLGTVTFFRKIRIQILPTHGSGLIKAWLSTFFLTIANPVTIISYCIIFAGLGLGQEQFEVRTLAVLLGGIATGAFCLMMLLIICTAMMRKKLSIGTLTILNKTAALILIVLGVVAILKAVLSLESVQAFCPKLNF